MTHSFDDRHGGPYDRGRADRYYGHLRNPHKFEGASFLTPKVKDLTPSEVVAYNAGYDEEDDRKDYGT